MQSVFAFEEQGGLVGRSSECNWQLADPERFISGVHARVGSDSAGFYIEDLSTNGLFYNSPGHLVGKGNRQYIAQNDMLYLGDYELKVTSLSLEGATVSDHSNPVGEAVDQGRDHSHVFDGKAYDGIPLPSASGNAILEEEAHISEPFNGSSFNGTAMEAPIDDYFDVQPLIPDDWAKDIAAQSVVENSADGFFEGGLERSVGGGSAHAGGKGVASSSSILHTEAFARGLGLSTAQLMEVADSEESWEALGESLRTSIEGIILAVRSRSERKNELRVNQTTFQARENNPLKFSIAFDDAFRTMFSGRSDGFMPPGQAIRNVFSDFVNHETALVEACGSMTESLVARLSPENVKKRDVGGGFLSGVSSTHARARYWSLYEVYHKELVEQYSRAQGKSYSSEFVESYEQAIQGCHE